jgi:hypothetical protein
MSRQAIGVLVAAVLLIGFVIPLAMTSFGGDSHPRPSKVTTTSRR